jgi:hypothetical protein
MTKESDDNFLDDPKLKAITERIKTRLDNNDKNLIGLGYELTEAKAVVPYGKWLKYLNHFGKKRFELGHTQATKLMHIARAHKAGEISSDWKCGTEVLAIIADPSTPPELAEEIKADLEAGKPVKAAAAKRRVQRVKGGKNPKNPKLSVEQVNHEDPFVPLGPPDERPDGTKLIPFYKLTCPVLQDKEGYGYWTWYRYRTDAEGAAVVPYPGERASIWFKTEREAKDDRGKERAEGPVTITVEDTSENRPIPPDPTPPPLPPQQAAKLPDFLKHLATMASLVEQLVATEEAFTTSLSKYSENYIEYEKPDKKAKQKLVRKLCNVRNITYKDFDSYPEVIWKLQKHDDLLTDMVRDVLYDLDQDFKEAQRQLRRNVRGDLQAARDRLCACQPVELFREIVRQLRDYDFVMKGRIRLDLSFEGVFGSRDNCIEDLLAVSVADELLKKVGDDRWEQGPKFRWNEANEFCGHKITVYDRKTEDEQTAKYRAEHPEMFEDEKPPEGATIN